MNEKSWERTDKGGSSTGSFDLRGRVSPFFVFFSLSSCYCISSLFFIEEEVNDDTWRKEHFLGKIPEIQKGKEFSTVGGVCID